MMKFNMKFGFEIRQRMNELKLAFDSAGYDGWISFIAASIRAGFVHSEEIVDEAVAITGPHIEDQFRCVIEEGIDVYWYKGTDGSLSVKAF